MAENTNQNTFRIGENGLTLEDVENRIIQLWNDPGLRRDDELMSTFRALKKARMEYLDALNINEEWLFTPDYEERRRRFESRIQEVAHRNFMELVDENLAKDPADREKSFEATEYWYFAPNDEHEFQLMDALSESKLMELTSKCTPNYDEYSFVAGHPTFRYGIDYDKAHGYDARFIALKENLSLADNDIVKLVNFNYEDWSDPQSYPTDQLAQKSLLKAIEDAIKAEYEYGGSSSPINGIYGDLLRRQTLLNLMYKGTEAEKQALVALNETLAKLEDELNAKSLQLWNTIKEAGIYKGEWLVRGCLDVENEEVHHIAWGYLFDKYGFLELPSDEEYGSDFKFMITAIGKHGAYGDRLPIYTTYFNSAYELPEGGYKKAAVDVNASIVSDEIEKIGFTPCEAMAKLLEDFSIPDILRINRFANKVELTQSTVYDHTGSTEFESETIMPPGYTEED